MKIKHQLLLSFGFLFVVILLLGGVGSYYIYRLAMDSRAIIKDNNRSLAYLQEIDEALNDIHLLLNSNKAGGFEEALSTIRENLVLQQANVTERGEEKLTGQLAAAVNTLEKALTDDPLDPSSVRGAIHEISTVANTIYHMNQDAIEQRNQIAGKTADEVFLYMIIFGTAGILIGLSFTMGMPSVISKPIKAFNEAISQLARGQYEVTVPISGENEFAQLAQSFNKMAQKLQEYEQSNLAKILMEKKRLDAVINQFNDAIIGLDDRKVIIFVNERALSILGVERKALLGQDASDFPLHNPLMQNLIRRLMTGFEEWEEEVYEPIKITEGNKEKLFTPKIIHISSKPAGGARKALIGHAIILTDITEFAKKDSAKTRFMATLSHQLKTPVAAIEMAASILDNEKTGELNNGQRECIEMIRENNKRIHRMINEILDLSKIESGSIEIINEKIDVEQLIEKAIIGVMPFAENKHIDIKTTLLPPKAAVLADPQKAIWVLNNLLTNAIRYSPENDVIEMAALESGKAITITVRDNGPGIEPQLKDKLFRPYSRKKGDKTEGAGLGLAISKEFIEAMGGSIGVHSELKRGASFWIKLRKPQA